MLTNYEMKQVEVTSSDGLGGYRQGSRLHLAFFKGTKVAADPFWRRRLHEASKDKSLRIIKIENIKEKKC